MPLLIGDVPAASPCLWTPLISNIERLLRSEVTSRYGSQSDYAVGLLTAQAV